MPDLKALRESLNRDWKGSDTELNAAPFPLKYLLILYSKSHLESYIDYHYGLRALISYLGPIEVNPILEQSDYDANLCGSYDIQKIAQYIGAESWEITDCLYTQVLEIQNKLQNKETLT